MTTGGAPAVSAQGIKGLLEVDSCLLFTLSLPSLPLHSFPGCHLLWLLFAAAMLNCLQTCHAAVCFSAFTHSASLTFDALATHFPYFQYTLLAWPQRICLSRLNVSIIYCIKPLLHSSPQPLSLVEMTIPSSVAFVKCRQTSVIVPLGTYLHLDSLSLQL